VKNTSLLFNTENRLSL